MKREPSARAARCKEGVLLRKSLASGRPGRGALTGPNTGVERARRMSPGYNVASSPTRRGSGWARIVSAARVEAGRGAGDAPWRVSELRVGAEKSSDVTSELSYADASVCARPHANKPQQG